MYSVNWWGSHPDANNEDCWIGKDFVSYDEALDYFHTTPGDQYYPTGEIEYVELVKESGIINGIKMVERIRLRANLYFRDDDRDVPSDWAEEVARECEAET